MITKLKKLIQPLFDRWLHKPVTHPFNVNPRPDYPRPPAPPPPPAPYDPKREFLVLNSPSERYLAHMLAKGGVPNYMREMELAALRTGVIGEHASEARNKQWSPGAAQRCKRGTTINPTAADLADHYHSGGILEPMKEPFVVGERPSEARDWRAEREARERIERQQQSDAFDFKRELVQMKISDLLSYADRMGVVITVERRSVAPLAMGRAVYVTDVRPSNKSYRGQQ